MSEYIMSTKMTHPFIWLLSQCRSYRWILLLAVILSSMAAILALGPYYVVYLIAEQLISRVAFEEIWPLAMLALGLMISRYGCLVMSVYFSHHSAFHIQYYIRMAALKQLSKTTLGYFNNKSSGGIKKNLTEDIDRIEVFIAHQLPDLISSFVTPLATFSLLAVVDYRMALVALIPVPLAALCQVVLFRDYKDKAQQYHQSIETLNSSVTEFARAMPVIRLFSSSERSFNRLDSNIKQHKNYLAEWTRQSGWPFAIFKVILNSGLAILVPVGLYLWSLGSLSAPSFLLCILLGVGMLEPLFNLTLLSTYLGQIFEGVARVMGIMSLPGGEQGTKKVNFEYHSIEFKHVSFCYGDKTQKAVDNVSFTLNPNSVNAIVGPSGAGKSTLAMLVAGFWSADSGQIKIGGISVADIPEYQLMASISFVFQDSFLFNQTIVENITMGSDYSEQQVIDAAKAACADNFIQALPDGYQTVIGKGTLLSGGEKQRIAIARAILKDSPIIILDEPTSHADATNQRYIQEALSRLVKGKIVLIVAHRLSTIQAVDQILVLKNGQLVEQGKHEELRALNGVYASMWDASHSTTKWKITNQNRQAEVNCV